MTEQRRRRINLSVDAETYGRLLAVSRAQGFGSVCQMVAALARIYLDRIEGGDTKRWDIPEDEGSYIDEMFSELADTERFPRAYTCKGPETKRR